MAAAETTTENTAQPPKGLRAWLGDLFTSKAVREELDDLKKRVGKNEEAIATNSETMMSLVRSVSDLAGHSDTLLTQTLQLQQKVGEFSARMAALELVTGLVNAQQPPPEGQHDIEIDFEHIPSPTNKLPSDLDFDNNTDAKNKNKNEVKRIRNDMIEITSLSRELKDIDKYLNPLPPPPIFYSLNDDHQLNHCTLYNNDLKREIESCSKNVGRIYSRYESEKKEDGVEWYCGSGFRASPNHIISARHVVKREHMINDRVYKLVNIFICFEIDCTIGKEVELEKLGLNQCSSSSSTTDGIYELVELDRQLVDSNYPDKLTSGSFIWNTVNDFTILQYKDKDNIPSSSSLTHYLVPSYPPNSQFETIYVVGYPSSIKMEKFKEDYPKDLNDQSLTEFYNRVKKQSGYFEQKVVSVATNGAILDDSLSTHMCPTLRGVSGGPISTNASGDSKFIGIHIGGSMSMKNNFSISVGHPAFVFLYFQHIANDAFIEQHQLHQYKEYYLSIKNKNM
ncbi:hypothetical protein DFA_07860 [Cavenderia fasciculata]|uniref:Peptidase S1 domain-containing protein n=1 Tax=Cavenderia fasciculata TaxID=261658 RepID=F4Q3R4_CACFS|nr:uncharacterized protein DFA_07860 [Cavenderia fasciculata]EGG16880.1 hypothetical protein DFA_07860 [Cavenderia fasciculata]|eukprot:XP_004355354.1 hypothetical protein DFA_07860 [Cavenderia fasciculata]